MALYLFISRWNDMAAEDYVSLLMTQFRLHIRRFGLENLPISLYLDADLV